MAIVFLFEEKRRRATITCLSQQQREQNKKELIERTTVRLATVTGGLFMCAMLLAFMLSIVMLGFLLVFVRRGMPIALTMRMIPFCIGSTAFMTNYSLISSRFLPVRIAIDIL